MKKFCVDVWEYATLVLKAKTSAEEIPAAGEVVEVDFSNPDTEFIGGIWGEEIAHGSLFFMVADGYGLSPKTWDGLPVVESQLAFDDSDSGLNS